MGFLRSDTSEGETRRCEEHSSGSFRRRDGPSRSRTPERRLRRPSQTRLNTAKEAQQRLRRACAPKSFHVGVHRLFMNKSVVFRTSCTLQAVEYSVGHG